MNRNPQSKKRYEVLVAQVIGAAALSFACGRSEIGDRVDEEVTFEVVDSSLTVEDLMSVPSLAQYRLELQIHGTIPVLNALPYQQPQLPTGPQLVEWNRREYSLQQLQFLPMVYFERRRDGSLDRYLVHFDGTDIMISGLWNERDQNYTSVASQLRSVDLVGRDAPLAMWSDLVGTVEPKCVRIDGHYDCSIPMDTFINAYFPSPVAKGKGPDALYCLDNCLSPWGTDEEPYFANIDDRDSQSPFDVVLEYEYTAHEMMLRFEGAELMPENRDPVVSGFMFENKEHLLALMACDVQGEVYTGVCSHHPLDTFFTWTSDMKLDAAGRTPISQY